MPTPYEEQSSPARIIFLVSAGAFLAGELVQAFRSRRGATSVDVRAKTLFTVMFFAGILMLPLGRAVLPSAVSGGAWESTSPSWSGSVKTSPSWNAAPIASCATRATSA
jgi:hypothetical protein